MVYSRGAMVTATILLALAMAAPEPGPGLPRGWVGAGGRNAFGPPSRVDPDFGGDLLGGAWILREHLMPIARIGWSRGGYDRLTVDALRFGGGLLAGAALLDERLWIGG